MKRLLLLSLALILLLASPAAAMQRRSSNAVDVTGRVITTAQVTVYLTGTTTKATIYSDNGVTTTANPFGVNGGDGSYAYYAANGRYDETVTAAGFIFSVGQTKDLKLYDLADVGPHAFGGATAAAVQLLLTGAFAPAAGATTDAMRINSTITAGAGISAGLLRLNGTLVEAASGDHTILAALDVAPSITAGVATATDVAGIRVQAITAQSGTTNASGIKVDAAPTGATNNYALWVTGGNIRVADGAVIGQAAGLTTNSRIVFASDNFDFTSGSARYRWFAADGTTERMQLTTGGILLVGTTVTTGASAGHVVLANSAALRGVNAAGSSTLALLALDGSNQTTLTLGSAAFVLSEALTQTTIGANGGASALTANPVGYLTVNIAGSNRIIPFYNP